MGPRPEKDRRPRRAALAASYLLVWGAVFTEDTHWTAVGHAVAAAEIARALERRAW